MVDYSVLEGREVKFVDLNNKYNVNNKIGIVVGCDRDIGITIINKYDENEYLLCHPGPSSSQMAGKEDMVEGCLAVFDFTVALIRDGVIDTVVLEEHIENVADWNVTKDASQETCPFY